MRKCFCWLLGHEFDEWQKEWHSTAAVFHTCKHCMLVERIIPT